MNRVGKLNQTAIHYIKKQRKRLNHTRREVAENALAKKGTELLRTKLALHNKEIPSSSELVYGENSPSSNNNSNYKNQTEGNTTGESSIFSSILSDSELKDFASGTWSDVKSLTKSASLPANPNKNKTKSNLLKSASL